MARLIHGTALVYKGRGLLIRGPSGSGKSILALRLMEQGGRLVADDQVFVSSRSGRLIATAPHEIKGLVELRGLGLIRAIAEPAVLIDLVGDLQVGPGAAHEATPEATPGATVDRMPDPETLKTEILGVALDRVWLPRERDAALIIVNQALEGTVTNP